MPATYFVDFTAYVDELRRPENFPREVHVQETYENVEDTQHLQMIVNDRFVKLVTGAGLVVLKDPTEIMASGVITFEKRRFIPWHLLTHMEVKVTLIPEPRQPQDVLIPPNSAPTLEKKSKEVVN